MHFCHLLFAQNFSIFLAVPLYLLGSRVSLQTRERRSAHSFVLKCHHSGEPGEERVSPSHCFEELHHPQPPSSQRGQLWTAASQGGGDHWISQKHRGARGLFGTRDLEPESSALLLKVWVALVRALDLSTRPFSQG